MSSEADQKMDIAIGHMLRLGVTIAACVVFSGWMVYLAHAHGKHPSYRSFHGQPILLPRIASIVHGALSLDGRSIIDIGILLLIATPVARVAFCIASFAAQKDKLYVLVSGIVFAILVYSLLFRS
ncbi:MAG TPA: DUF1634 domain-containing protein [Acidobacteriaceae bacterium]|jgi:uncharacterized membrane protein|nr:DUF1634 domain-containing protein [Acidobacteriaceae bacterium]